jgi:hypothetical protein
MMKKLHFLLLLSGFAILFSSCSLFKPKYGCESNGKNVGAEKLLDGGPKKKRQNLKDNIYLMQLK